MGMPSMVRTIYQQPWPPIRGTRPARQGDRSTPEPVRDSRSVSIYWTMAGPDVLAFSKLPTRPGLGRKSGPTTHQERLNKEIRRSHRMWWASYGNRPAVRRLVGAVLAEQHDEWAVGCRYLTPAILTFNEALDRWPDLAEATAA